nr:MAG TPA: Single strand binding protein [Caudoviricetes sp.]
MNSCVLIGRTTRDIELRRTGNGTAVASFTLAVNRDFKTNDGQEADFIQCVAWKKTAELLEQYVHKGDRIALNGSIRTRNYEDSHGRTVYVTEVLVNYVEFLETKREMPSDSPSNQNKSDPYNGLGNPGYGYDIDSSDLPF